MENEGRFQYKSLRLGNKRVPTRLLKLLPGSAGEPIKCSIVNVDLCDNPEYESLSYCWGDTADTIRVHIAEEWLDITRNLHDALVKLRNEEGSRTLWVDAICINQNDLSERSQQVRIMRQIYQQSKRTLVWLGSDDQDTERAFELIPYLLQVFCEAFKGNPRPIRLEPQIAEHPSIRQLYQQLRLFGPFLRLEQRPYFSRTWIIQELAVSWMNVTLIWGQHSLSWQEYAAAMLTFTCLEIRKANIRKPLGSFLEMVFPAVQIAASQTPTLLSLLDRYREQESTDPRDKVYALLGLAQSKDVDSLACEIDYHMDVVEVYTQLARSYIQRDVNLDILGYVNCGSSIPGLPSWVPDWTNQEGSAINFRKPNPFNTRLNYHAGGDNGCDVGTFADRKTLNSKGIIFDKITRVSTLTDATCDCCCRAHDWETIAELEGQSHYVAGGTALDALFMTLLAGCSKPQYDILKGRLIELWEAAKKHAPSTIMHGSFPTSTPSGPQRQNIRLIPISPVVGEAEGSLSSSLAYSGMRRFARTHKGYYALVPAQAVVEDHIAILKGGNYPFVLRSQAQDWSLVGECYLHGIMQGEKFDEDNCERLLIL